MMIGSGSSSLRNTFLGRRMTNPNFRDSLRMHQIPAGPPPKISLSYSIPSCHSSPSPLVRRARLFAIVEHPSEFTPELA